MKKRLLLCIVLSLLVGCKSDKIVIAEQYGLAYAPIQVMKTLGYYEDLVDQEVEWVKLGNTAAIREAMLADQLDVGFLGIPPFLIAYDQNVEWRIFTGLSQAPLGLMGREDVAFDTLKPTDRIALPQPGSIQHILLSMASEKTFGDADYFDQLVTLKHPDGMQALINGIEVDYHFTSPPYLFEESEQGNHLIIDGETCMGEPFTFIVGVTEEEFYNTDAYTHFLEALDQTLIYMENNPEETIEILKSYYDYDNEKLRQYIYGSGMIYSREILGLTSFIEFMNRSQYIHTYYTEENLIWEN